ncbi:hypothetical protein ROBYS_15050 [Roseobacter sp. OBYS 0001]|nr:hypothetical protein ROBYS_15050 [Roseobacter sp. OBYS 0001]
MLLTPRWRFNPTYSMASSAEENLTPRPSEFTVQGQGVNASFTVIPLSVLAIAFKTLKGTFDMREA